MARLEIINELFYLMGCCSRRGNVCCVMQRELPPSQTIGQEPIDVSVASLLNDNSLIGLSQNEDEVSKAVEWLNAYKSFTIKGAKLVVEEYLTLPNTVV